MRVPSIHITKEDLIEILRELGSLDVSNVDEFMILSRRVALTHRSVNITTKKMSDKATKVLAGTIGDANLLSDIIYATRIKLKHLGVTKIKQSDQQWGNLKELVPVINSFCEREGLDTREGYIKFVAIGFELMKEAKKVNYVFAPLWMAQRAETILERYKGQELIHNDESAARTIQMHDLYVNMVADKTGIIKRFNTDPSNWQFFVIAKRQADEYNVDYGCYLTAQFFALEFCNGIPKPSDLGGDKASTRLIEYVSKSGIDLNSKSNNVTIDWSKFKR